MPLEKIFGHSDYKPWKLCSNKRHSGQNRTLWPQCALIAKHPHRSTNRNLVAWSSGWQRNSDPLTYVDISWKSPHRATLRAWGTVQANGETRAILYLEKAQSLQKLEKSHSILSSGKKDKLLKKKAF